MEALISILLFFLFAAFILRHLGRFILPFLARRMAKRFGMDTNAFTHKTQARAQQPNSPRQQQIIPDEVGEYVDFEEVK
jgi:hypothetical protein